MIPVGVPGLRQSDAVRVTSWRAVHLATLLVAVGAVGLLLSASWDPGARVLGMAIAALIASVLGAVLLASAALTGRGGPVDLRDVARAVQHGQPTGRRSWSWQRRFERSLVHDLGVDPWTPYFFGGGQGAPNSPDGLAGEIVARRAALAAATGAEVAERRQSLDLWMERRDHLVTWSGHRFQQAAAEAQRRRTLAAVVLVGLGLLGAVWTATTGVHSDDAVVSTDGAWVGLGPGGRQVLRTVVDVRIQGGVPSGVRAVQHCPGLGPPGSEIEARGFLLASDDSDAREDGPFTVLLADSRCAGQTLVVDAGDGHYTSPPTSPTPGSISNPTLGSTPSPAPTPTTSSSPLTPTAAS
jgi:hypothetical protein